MWFQFKQTGYLPAPFVYDKNDTYMDLFHPMFWSDNMGVYTTWGSVYPPINFLFLQPIKYLITSSREAANAFELRADAGKYPVWLFVGYAAIPFLMLRSRLWRVFSAREIIPIFLAIVFASPMLFTLERGNLILLALPVLALAVAATGTLCCIAVAILINIKPYFAIIIFAFFLVRRFEYALITTLAAGAIFLLSGILLDENFMFFVPNVLNFSQEDALFSVREMLSLPSTLSHYAQVLRAVIAQGGGIGLRGVEAGVLATTLEALKWMVLAISLGGLWFARALPLQIVVVVSIAIISNLGTWVGGYSFIFYLPLVPILMKMRYRKLYLGIVLTMFAPLDIVSLLKQDIGLQDVYLSGQSVVVEWSLALGVFVRPPLNLALLVILTFEIIERFVPVERRRESKRDVPEALGVDRHPA
ncbi:hypothetical protein [Tardiphaga sp.]|uniref:hypothetical protein n=1 Tax=Tardiphaga sp. TaxID=1926292 RepID=UPI00260F06CC|nr:hypothetical protein [Tardiphaga sp.]